jgi:hypothetical protein
MSTAAATRRAWLVIIERSTSPTSGRPSRLAETPFPVM